MNRRALSFITALALCLSLCPVQVLADDVKKPSPKITISLMADVTDTKTYNVSDALKYDTAGFSYTVSGYTAMSVKEKGSLFLTTGKIESTKGAGIEVQTGGQLYVEQLNMTVIGTTYGLDIASDTTVQLSGGTFSGKTAAIRIASGSYDDLLATGFAYFDEGGNTLLPNEVVGLKTVSVKECTDHRYSYVPVEGVPTHSWTCQACGATGTEKCTFSFDADGHAECEKCDHELAITINPDKEEYTGEPKPSDNVSVTVEMDDIALESTNYTVSYLARTDVGEVTITVTGETYIGTYTKIFSVTQATPGIAWDSNSATVFYDGSPVEAADLPNVTITPACDVDEAELRSLLYFSYKKTHDSNGNAVADTGFTKGLPTDAGTYQIKASLPETTNYKPIDSAEITLTINKIDPIETAPAAVELVYNKTAQKLVTSGTLNHGAVGAVIKFATSSDGPWSTDIPTGINAGDYTVYYKVDGTNNYDGVGPTKIEGVEILRKTITPDVELEYTSHEYTGGALQPAVTVSDKDDGTVLPVTEYNVAYGSNVNVGTNASVTITDKEKGNYEIEKTTVTFEITPADQDALTITNRPNTVVYGDVFTLGTSGGSGNGTVTWKITTGGGIAEVDNGGHVTVKGVGTVTVQATKSGTDNDGNHTDATAEWTFTAGPKHVTATVTAEDKTYDGTKTAEVKAEVPLRDIVDGDSITITGLAGTFSDENAGTGKVVNVDNENAQITGADNYIVTIPATTTATINKAKTEITQKPTQIDPALTYNGGLQALVSEATAVSITHVDPNGEAIVVEYALNANGGYSTDIPQATDAGQYEVWYRVRETSNYVGTVAAKVIVTIYPKTLGDSAITLNQSSYEYDGTEKSPTVTVKDGVIVIPASEYTVSYSNNVNVGTATVTITDNPGGNYNVSGSVTFSITQGSAVLTSPPQARDLTYNTQEQELVTAGTATGGHLKYALKEGDDEPAEDEYTDEIPTGIDARTYTVYYKVVGDGNHADSAVASVTVTIQKKTVVNPVITLTLPESGYVYDGAEKEPTVTVKDGDTPIGTTDSNGVNDEYEVTYSNNMDAGTATVHIIDKDGGNYIVNGSTEFEITKAPAKFEATPAAIENLEYDGTPQRLVTAGESSDGTVVYSQDGANFTLNIPIGINAGSYTVWYMVRGDKNHTDSEPKSVQVEIARQSGTDLSVTLSQTSYVYDGSAKQPTVTVKDGTTVIPATEYDVEYSNNMNAGTATVTVKAKTNGNYSFNKTANFTIEKADAVLTSPPKAVENLIYNGQAQNLVMVGAATGGTLMYSTDGSIYKATIPTEADAGTYTVYYKIEGDNNHNDTTPSTVSVTIQPKTVVNPTITLSNVSFTYNGSEQKPNVSSVAVNGETISANQYTVTYSNNVNAGTATVHIRNVSGGNYIINATAEFTIEKADPTVSTPPTPKTGLKYTGTAQELIARGSSPDGTMVYSLERNGIYSEAIPTGTAVQEYTVYYKVLGDSNHKDSTVDSVSVTIDKNTVSNPTITLSADTFRYNGSQQIPTVTVRDDSNRLIPENEYEVEITGTGNNNSSVDADTYTVKITTPESSNYSFTGTTSYTITKADQSPLTIGNIPSTVYYDDRFTLTVSGGSGTGAVTWASSDTTVADVTNGVVTVNKTGDFTITVTQAEDTNYKKASVSCSFTAQPKPVTAVVTAASKEYDGTNNATLTVTVPGSDLTGITTGVTGTFADPNVGTGKTVKITVDSNVSATGGDISNYLITWPATATADITPKTITPTVKVSEGPHTYTGSPITPGVTVTYTDGGQTKTLLSTDYTIEYSNNINAGDNTATVTVRNVTGGNYAFNGSGAFTIDKATPTFTAPTPKTGLTYNGTAQNLINRGSTSGGTMVYSLDNVNYYEDIPTSVAAGDYPVYYKVLGDSNHEDAAGGQVTAKIEKADQAPITIFNIPSGAIYYGDSFTLTVFGGSGNGAVTWESSNKNVATVNSSGFVEIKDAGEVTITAKKAASDNYKEATATWTFTAQPKPASATVTANDKTYDGNVNAALNVTWAGLVNDDTIYVTGKFDNENVGTDKTVDITYTTDARYTVTIPATTTASITQAKAEWENGSGPQPAFSSVTVGSTAQLIFGIETKNSIGTVEYAVEGPVSSQEEISLQNEVIDEDSNDGSGSSGLTYASTVPTARDITEPGTYRIWYRIVETDNYTGIDPAYVVVEIVEAQKSETPSTPPASTPSQPPSSGSTPSTSGTSKPSSTPSAAPEPEEPPETGAPDETVPSVETSVQDGVASTVVNCAAGDELVDQAVANGSEAVIIKPEIDGDVTKTEVSLPASTVSRIRDETDAVLTVSTPVADVTIPNGALEALSGAGDAVSIVTERVENMVVLTLTADGEDVREISGGLTLTVPVKDAGPGTVAVLVYEDGTRETLRWSVAEDGVVRIPLDGSATVEIVDNSKEFEDVSKENWASDAVAFASAHELFIGTSETTFSPELLMSRGMLATVLYNLDGQPGQELTVEFSDVDSDIWYAAGISWAAANGIAGGYGNGRFGPDDSVTREQFVVMLWRYAGSPTTDIQALDFSDADQASGYAMEALCWAAENNILRGYGDGRLDPGGVATRAQAAQMLKNFIMSI